MSSSKSSTRTDILLSVVALVTLASVLELANAFATEEQFDPHAPGLLTLFIVACACVGLLLGRISR